MMGWRDLIVTSQPREGVTDKPTEGHSVYFVDSVSKYENKSSLSIQDSSRNSIPAIASTKYTEPIAPLQPGWLVAYRDVTYRLRGGCDEREHGTVAKLEWVHGSWTVWLTNGEALSLRRVLSVGKTDNDGQVVSAWTTRDCGYNGEGELSGII